MKDRIRTRYKMYKVSIFLPNKNCGYSELKNFQCNRINRINEGRRIKSDTNRTLIGASDFSQYQRAIFDWPLQDQELFDVLTENAEENTREDVREISNFL